MRKAMTTPISYEDWRTKFAEALAALQPGFTPADLSFPYMNFDHDGWTPYTACQELIETHVLHPELDLFTRPLLEPSTSKQPH